MFIAWQKLLHLHKLSFFGASVIASITENVQTVDGSGIIEPNDVRKGIFTKATDVIIKGTIGEIADSSFLLHSSLRNVQILAPITIIHSTVFPGCVESVSLGTSLTNIKYRSFIGSFLTEVHFPPSIVEIENQVFVICRSLKKIVFDDFLNCRLQSIGGDAFRDSPIESLELPQSLISIGNGAFSAILAETVTLGPSVTTFFGAFSGSFVINLIVHSSNPNFVNSNSAIYTKNGQILYAVESSQLTHVSVNANTIRIGQNAFHSSNISQIDLVESIAILEDRAFLSCKYLKSIALPQSLQAIWAACFLQSGLISLTLPLGLTAIGDSVFNSCPNLVSVSVDPSHPLFSSDSQGILYDKLQTKIIFIPINCLPRIQLPITINTLSQNGFQLCNFTELILNEGITIIPFGCIFQCPELKELRIPRSVTTFGEASVASNPKLEKIIFEANSNFKTSYLSFHYNPMLHTVDFGLNSKVEVLSIFMACPKLASITIPPSIKKIDVNCFTGCYSLGSIEISSPNNVEIGQNAFSECNSLTTAKIDLPSIMDGAFANCYGLTNLYLSPRITRIGANSFANCGKLNNIVFENIESSTLQRIESLGFSECSELVEINLPSSIQYLTASSFSFSIKLLNITIRPNGIYRDIDGVVYKGFGNDQTFVACPNGRETIQVVRDTRILGENSFTGCGILRNVNFNQDIIEISAYCFSGCKSLLELNIPTGTQKVGTKAFENCDSLKLVYFCSDQPIPFGDGSPFPDFTLIIVKATYQDDMFLGHPVIKSHAIDPSGCPIRPSFQFTNVFKKRQNFLNQLFSLFYLLPMHNGKLL